MLRAESSARAKHKRENLSDAAPHQKPHQRRSGRIEWIDAARGVAVVLVVVGHYFMFVASPSMSEPVSRVWSPILDQLATIRMPLLFVLSGMLVSARITAGWRDPKTAQRFRVTSYIYLIWVAAYALVWRLLPEGLPYRFADIGDTISQVWHPDTPLWFIFALSVYTALFASLSSIPKWLVLTAALAFGMWSATLPGDRGQIFWLHILTYSMFFAAGVYARTLFVWFANVRKWPTALGLLALGLTLVPSATSLQVSLGVLSIAHSVAGFLYVCAAIWSISVMCRSKRFARVSSWFGTRTLPLYVLHMPVIFFLIEFHKLVPLSWFPGEWAWPITGAGVVLLGCLGAEWILRRARFDYLFDAPSWVRRDEPVRSL